RGKERRKEVTPTRASPRSQGPMARQSSRPPPLHLRRKSAQRARLPANAAPRPIQTARLGQGSQGEGEGSRSGPGGERSAGGEGREGNSREAGQDEPAPPGNSFSREAIPAPEGGEPQGAQEGRRKAREERVLGTDERLLPAGHPGGLYQFLGRVGRVEVGGGR